MLLTRDVCIMLRCKAVPSEIKVNHPGLLGWVFVWVGGSKPRRERLTEPGIVVYAPVCSDGRGPELP